MLFLTDIFNKIDTAIYKKVYIDHDSAGLKLADNITVVNIEKPELDSKTESLSQFRNRIISFLKTVAERHENHEDPKAILFDISFSKDSTQLDELKKAIEDVRERKIKVYAVYNMREYFDGGMPVFEVNDGNQARVLYDSVLSGGRLHSGFVVNDGLIHYPSEIFLKKAFGDTVAIESIVKRVALDQNPSQISSRI